MKRRVHRRLDYSNFWREVTQDGKAPCALREARLWRRSAVAGGRGGYSFVHVPCSGQIDAHHYVPKRRLRTDAAKLDVRNGVPLCRTHHDLVEQAALQCPRPPMLSFFLHEHNVTDPANRRPEAAVADPDQ